MRHDLQTISPRHSAVLRNLRKKQVSAVSAVGAAASVKRRKLLRTVYNYSHPVTDPTAPSLTGLLASVDVKQLKLTLSHRTAPFPSPPRPPPVVGRNTHAHYYAVTFCTRIQHTSLIPPSLNYRRPKSSALCTRGLVEASFTQRC